MTAGLGVGAVVTLYGDSRSDWWAVTAYTDKPCAGRKVHLSRWLPDEWVRSGPGEWWPYTEVDTTRTVWWFQVGSVVFPAVCPWQVA